MISLEDINEEWGYSLWDIIEQLVECQDSAGRLGGLLPFFTDGALGRACNKIYGAKASDYEAAFRLLMSWEGFDDAAWSRLATAERKKPPKL